MRRLTACLMAALLAGCSHYEPLSLHGAASMRVEVEVYKGPLTSPVVGQMGQLVGVLSDTVRDVYAWRERANQVCNSRARQDSDDDDDDIPSTAECAALQGPLSSSKDILGAGCYLIESPTLAMTVGRAVYIPKGTCDYLKRRGAETDRRTRARAATPTDPKAGPPPGAKYEATRTAAYAEYVDDYYPLLKTAADQCKAASSDVVTQLKCQGDIIVVAFDNLSAIVSGAARRAADKTVTGVPTNPRVLSLLVEYASMTDQYGEQLHSRISVLQKQMAETTGVRDPRTLAVSDYLRNASRTDYIELFDWLNAAEPATGDPRPPLNTAERIRMAQRLTADAYWQKINEVYTSGQGDVATAFIKDDLGNWDLKSFSNDPSNLLAAYRSVTNAALKTAADLTLKAGSGAGLNAASQLSSAQKAASLANQLATGETPGTPATVAGMDIARLHDRTSARIAAQKTRFDTQATNLGAEIAKQNALAATAAAAQADLDSKLARANQTIDVDTTALNNAKAALATAKTDGSDAAAIATAQTTANTALATLTSDQATAKAAQDAADANKAATQTAQIAAKAAQARLDDLPKDAVEAVRATLDDHLAVVSALQDGIAGPAAPAAPRPSLPAMP